MLLLVQLNLKVREGEPVHFFTYTQHIGCFAELGGKPIDSGFV